MSKLTLSSPPDPSVSWVPTFIQQLRKMRQVIAEEYGANTAAELIG